MRLRAGGWTLEAAPARGGAILSLRRDGHDVLRPAPAGASDLFDVACFPMVPYANRIADGTFRWEGRTCRVPRNHPRQAHPLHGVGWARAWTVAAQDEASATMRLDHPGDADWPWPFVAEQRLALSAAGLDTVLAVTNTGDRPMPATIGFHPYFPRAETLSFAAEGVWLADAAMLPTVSAPADTLGDWSAGGALARPDLVDHCYTGWRGTARIAGVAGETVLEGDNTPALHVYCPPGEDFFCAEPVTAMPDAINRGAAAVLAPGEELRIAMRIGRG